MTSDAQPVFVFYGFSGSFLFSLCVDGVCYGPEGEVLEGPALVRAASLAERSLVHTPLWSATNIAVLSLVQRAAHAESRVKGAAGTTRAKLSEEELDAVCRAALAQGRSRNYTMNQLRESGRAVSHRRLREAWALVQQSSSRMALR